MFAIPPALEAHMRPSHLLFLAVAVAACSGSDQAADSAAMQAGTAMPAPINLADVAGTWTMKGMNMAGDSTIVTYELMATADTAGWTITFPGARPIPVRITGVSGDSVMVEAGPYASVVRKGTKVSTTGVFRMQNGMLVGTTTARYAVKTADSVLMVRSEGTRKP